MPATVPELIEQLSSPDFTTRALALAALVEQGAAATAGLARALGEPDDRVRAQAAQALSEIADPEAADALANATADTSGDVRGYAALGLARIGDHRANDALVNTLDELPDLEHHPYSASVYGLIDIGQAALPAVVPLLGAPDPTTRARAFIVVRAAVESMPEIQDWNELWGSLGRFDPYGENPARDAAARNWQGWVADHT